MFCCYQSVWEHQRRKSCRDKPLVFPESMFCFFLVSYFYLRLKPLSYLLCADSRSVHSWNCCCLPVKALWCRMSSRLDWQCPSRFKWSLLTRWSARSSVRAGGFSSVRRTTPNMSLCFSCSLCWHNFEMSQHKPLFPCPDWQLTVPPSEYQTDCYNQKHGPRWNNRSLLSLVMSDTGDTNNSMFVAFKITSIMEQWWSCRLAIVTQVMISATVTITPSTRGAWAFKSFGKWLSTLCHVFLMNSMCHISVCSRTWNKRWASWRIKLRRMRLSYFRWATCRTLWR